MAAVSPCEAAQSVPRDVVIKTEPDCEEDVLCSPRDVAVKRDPVVPLLSPISGLQPLSWSQDHRLAVCTANSLSLIELVCDAHSNKQDLTLHRSSIPVPAETNKLRVNNYGFTTDTSTSQEIQLNPGSFETRWVRNR